MIFLSGVDRTGKSTLVKNLSDLTKYRHYIADRSPICNLVYDKIYKRDKDGMRRIVLLDDIEYLLDAGAWFVLLNFLDEKIILQRAKETGETHVDSIDEICKHRIEYLETFKELGEIFESNAFIVVNIDGKMPYDLAKEINSKINYEA